MNKNSILLIDPNFEPANSSNLSLLIKIGADTFSYAITDEEQNFVFAVYDEQECDNVIEKFKERLKSDAYLSLPYQTVRLAVYTPNIVFVPNELFIADDVNLYAQFFVDADTPNIYVQASTNQEFTSVFTIPKAIESLMEEYWKNCTLMPYDAGLIAAFVTTGQNTIAIDFTVGAFQLLYFKDNQLHFAQNYQFEDIEELTYYLLLITSQLGINTKNTVAKICGIIHENDDKWNLLSQHFGTVDFLTASTNLDTNILDDMPSHYYTSLLSLQQCG